MMVPGNSQQESTSKSHFSFNTVNVYHGYSNTQDISEIDIPQLYYHGQTNNIHAIQYYTKLLKCKYNFILILYIVKKKYYILFKSIK